MRIIACILTATLLPGLTAWSVSDDAETARTKEGLNAFQTYLKKTYPDKKWQKGPLRFDAPALRAAYEGQRFYYVYSSPPMLSGAINKEVWESYRRKVEDIEKNYVSVTVRVDEAGRVVALMKPQDYDGGLRKVASDDDARTAAAAILALVGCEFVAPAAVDSKEIGVTRTDKGWSCRTKGNGIFEGTVSFDAAGHCTSISKSYAGSYPP